MEQDMKVKFISKEAYDQELLSFNIEFPELTRDDFDLQDGGLGDFVIAQYTEDGQIYIELTLSSKETTKLFRYLY